MWGKKIFDHRSEVEQIADAKKEKADWGYKPRYDPVYDYSLKKEKYSRQSRSEEVHDTPRIVHSMHKEKKRGLIPTADIKVFTYLIREHNREPGVFDYNYP